MARHDLERDRLKVEGAPLAERDVLVDVTAPVDRREVVRQQSVGKSGQFPGEERCHVCVGPVLQNVLHEQQSPDGREVSLASATWNSVRGPPHCREFAAMTLVTTSSPM